MIVPYIGSPSQNVSAFIKKRNMLPASAYVQDGLIAMWDGIENAGGGVHDPNAAVWKDLIGSLDGTISGIWTDNSLSSANFNADLKISGRWSGNFQIEIVCLINSRSNDTASLKLGRYGCIVVPNNNNNFVITWGTTKTLSQATLPIQSKFSISCYPSSAKFWMNSQQIENSSDEPPAFSGENDTQQFLNGCMGELFCVRRYSRLLTSEEIAANYAVDKLRFKL